MSEHDDFGPISVAGWHQLRNEERLALINKEIELCRQGQERQMAKHMHDWEWNKILWRCKHKNCDEFRTVLDAQDSLNATERLSAENVTYLGGLAWESSHRKEKKSQEPMLEDSEMQVRLEGAVEREKELMRKCIAYAKILEK